MRKSIVFFLDFDATLAKLSANQIGIFLSGYIITIPNILNNRCVKATVTAAGFSVAKEASIAVIVVPRLAPRV